MPCLLLFNPLELKNYSGVRKCTCSRFANWRMSAVGNLHGLASLAAYFKMALQRNFDDTMGQYCYVAVEQ